MWSARWFRAARAASGAAAGGAALVMGAAEVQGRRAEAQAGEKRTLYAWGSNQFGQLGVTTLATDQFKPQCVDAERGLDAQSISAFGEASAVADQEGSVLVFGRSGHGSLGQGDAFDNCTAPKPIPELEGLGARSIALGEFHMACVDKNGALWTAGRNWTGEVGRSGESSRMGQAAGGIRFTQAACGRTFSAAVDEEGRLFTWGNGKQGVLGSGKLEPVSEPVAVALPGGVRAVGVDCGQEVLLVVTEDGKVLSCGNNDYGKLGYESARIQPQLRPIAALAREKVVAVAAGDYHCAALTEDGKLFTWGAGGDGQLGHGSRRDLTTPTQVRTLNSTPISMVACGGSHTMAATQSGELFVWGKGRNGQLGAGDELESVAAYHTTPHRVEFFRGQKVVAVAAGRDHSLCLVASS